MLDQLVSVWWIWLADRSDTASKILQEGAPGPLKPFIAALPDWSILGLAFLLVAIVVVTPLLRVSKFLYSMWMRVFRKEDYQDQKRATHGDVKSIDRKLKTIIHNLNTNEQRSIGGGFDRLSNDERELRNAAAKEIVREETLASKKATQQLLDKDFSGALATLKQDAIADTAMAAKKWRRIGDLTIGTDTSEALAAYEEAFKIEPNDFWTSIKLARLRREAGNVKDAREVALHAARMADNERNRMVAANTLGDVLQETGDVAGAENEYHKSLAISQRLAKVSPGCPIALRDLQIVYSNLGTVVRLRNYEKAKFYFETALDISKCLSRRYPQVADNQRKLWVCSVDMGDILREGKYFAEARAHCEFGLGVLKRFEESKPELIVIQRDLSLIYTKLGQILHESGDLTGAKTFYEKGLEVKSQLAKSNPGSALAQRDVIVSCNKLGDVHFELNNNIDAETYYKKGLAISARLEAASESSATAKRDLSISFSKIGSVALKNGHISRAETMFGNSEELRRKVALANPNSTQAQRDLAIIHQRLGDVFYLKGDLEGANERFKQALAISETIEQKDPNSALIQADLCIIRNRISASAN